RRHTRWPRDWSSDVCSSDLKSKAFEKRELIGRSRPVRLIRQSQTYAIAEIAAMLLLAGTLCAQQVTTGAISGTVTDPTGAAVPRSEERRVGKECSSRRGSAR